MKESVVFICLSVLVLFIQSCSSTEEIRFEDMTEYELARYNLLQSTPDQVVCFGPSEDLLMGDFKEQRKVFHGS